MPSLVSHNQRCAAWVQEEKNCHTIIGRGGSLLHSLIAPPKTLSSRPCQIQLAGFDQNLNALGDQLPHRQNSDSVLASQIQHCHVLLA